MKRRLLYFFIAFLVLAITRPLAITSPAIAADYTLKQLTFDSVDHRWPSINNSGVIAYSKRVGGSWQIFKLPSGGGAETQVTAAGGDYTFSQYPTIDDAGVVIAASYKPAVAYYDLVKYPGGTFEYSTRDRYSFAHRDAGIYSGRAKDGVAIWYYDFYNSDGSFRGRRLWYAGAELVRDWQPRDMPDINAASPRGMVYSDGGSIYKTTVVAPTGGSWLAQGTNPRINTRGKVVYVRAGQVYVHDGVVEHLVGEGRWADITDDDVVVLERLVGGVAQIFLAKPTLLVSTESLANGMIDVPYSQTLTAINGVTPYSWSINSGTLPAGLILNPASGVITGTPTKAGLANFVVKVTDNASTPASATKSLSIGVKGNPLAVIKGPKNIYAGKTGEFDGTGSIDQDEDGASIVDWQWAFQSEDGDPVFRSGPIVTFDWIERGTYNVDLTVTDNEGMTDTKSVSVKVWPLLVAVDAGHGVVPCADPDGRETTASPTLGLHENRLTLTMALQAATTLSGFGIDTFLTRSGPDELEASSCICKPSGCSPAIKKRREMAKEMQVGAFVSIHTNASDNHKANGTYTIVRSESPNSAMEDLLAGQIQSYLITMLNTKNTGVVHAPHPLVLDGKSVPGILASSYFPSALTEVAFSSNSELNLAEGQLLADEQQLGDATFLRRAGVAIGTGVWYFTETIGGTP